MPTTYKEELKKYKDYTQHEHTSEDDENVSFKKSTKHVVKPWVLEYHYTLNKDIDSMFEWIYGWHRQDHYKTEGRAIQAMEQLKKTAFRKYDNYRIYDSRKGEPLYD